MDTLNKYVSIPLKNPLSVTYLISLFHYKYPRHFEFKGESHNFWELLYVDQGVLEIITDSRKFLLKSGEIAFHHPNEFHALRTYDDNPASAIICSFTCDHPYMSFFKGYVNTLDAKSREFLHEMLYLRAQLFFNDSVPFRSTPRPIDQIPVIYLQTVRSYLELILLNTLIRNKYQAGNTYLKPDLPLQFDSYHTLTQSVIIYMKENLHRKLSMQQIASAVGYSVSRMKQLFHNDMQQGVMEYFNKLKIDEAKRAINEGAKTLSQIATELGFNDVAYLCRKFKQYEGMTISEFRRFCLSGEKSTP